MEQNQEQKQGTLVKVTFFVGIAAAVFVLLAFAASGLLWVSDILGIAGIILAIVAFVKKLEPKKYIFIGGGLSLFATILSLSGVIGSTEEPTAPYSYSYESSYSAPSVNYSAIKEKAYHYTECAYKAELNKDDNSLKQIAMEAMAYIETLNQEELTMFDSYCEMRLKELKNGAATK